MPRPIPSGLKVAAVGLVGLVVLAPVLYLGSMRPAYAWHRSRRDLLNRRLPTPDEIDAYYASAVALDDFYAPIWWIGDRSKPTNRAVCWWAGVEFVDR